MNKIKRILEFAMELGDTPDAINPKHKRALATGEHPLGKNPAFPAHQGQGMNPHEQHATGTYKAIAANVQRYGGHMPRSQSPRELMRVAQDMFQTLHTIQQREAEHVDELQALAVETVMRLPEFKTLRRAVQSGQLKIEAHLRPRIDIQGMQAEKPEDEPEFEVPEIKQEYDELIHKRKMINTLIQGAAVSNNYAFSYYSRDELNAIDPSLIRDYGKLMAYSELGYFIQDPDMVKMAAAAGGSEAQGGEEKLKRDEDGNVTIVARGITFPILVQEIIKGCMEYLSYSDEEDPETSAVVNKQADLLGDEQVQMQVGPNIYRQMIDAIGLEQAEVWPYLHDELVRMPASEFNAKMQGLIKGTPEGKAWFRDLAQRVKAEVMEREGEDQTESLAKRITGAR